MWTKPNAPEMDMKKWSAEAEISGVNMKEMGNTQKDT